MSTNSYPGAAPFLPPGRPSIAALGQAAHDCRGCDLFERASQVVFGAGNPHARVMLIGEQPGDAEDRQGKPFVGPAGRVLDRALGEAGIATEDSYVTNAVKHFRWRNAPGGGKRRIHQRPDTWQIRACEPWLSAEIERVDPRVIVALGATAGQALFGASFRVGSQRGQAVPWTAGRNQGAEQGSGDHEVTVVPTIHPSAVLRASDRDSAYSGLVHDLAAVSEVLRREAGMR